MIAKKEKRDATTSPKGVVPSQGAAENFDDPLFVAGPIGMKGQPTLEEWYALREAMFDELPKFCIPQNLVDAVRNFRPHASVTWLNDKGAAAGPEDVLVEPVLEELRRKSRAEMEQFLSDGQTKFRELSKPALPKTAGDALAGCLLYQLALTNTETAPVRSKKMLAPSVIAGVAIYILETCALFDQPAGQELIALFRALLKVDRRPLKSSREFSARYKAAWILAQRPNVSTRELARILDVEPSSVSRWRKDVSFGKMVDSKKRSIQDLKAPGIWPPPGVSQAAAAEEKAIRDILSELKKARNELPHLLASCRTNAETTQIEEAIKQLDKFLSKAGSLMEEDCPSICDTERLDPT